MTAMTRVLTESSKSHGRSALSTGQRVGIVVAILGILFAGAVLLAPTAMACPEAATAPKECLPAYRWPNPLIWTDSGGLLGQLINIVPRLIGGIAGFGINIAGAIWMALLAGLNVVMGGITSDNFLRTVVVSVNDAFVGMRGYINVAVPLAIILGLLWRVVPALSSGGVTGRFFEKLSKLILPLGLLWAMALAAGAATAENPTPPGSPGWLVEKGWDIVELPTNLALEGLARVGGGSGVPVGGTSTAHCQYYTSKLWGAYASSGIGAQTKTSTMAMAMAWEGNFLNNYYIIQYGSLEVGQQVGCRLLESERGTPPTEQRSINGAFAESAFLSRSDEDEDKRLKLLSWMLCADPSDPSPLLIEEKSGNKADATAACETWLANGGEEYPAKIGAGFFGGGGNEDHFRKMADRARENPAYSDPQVRERIANEERAAEMLQGAMSGFGEVMVGGLASFIGVLGMAAMLGFPIFGAVMSSFILVFLFMALPIALVSSALDLRLGRTIVRGTILMIFAQSFFMLLIGMVTVFLNLGGRLIDALF